MQRPNIFLDYGGLIFENRFNHDTLFRAHGQVRNYLKLSDGRQISEKDLSQAHDSVIREYLEDRKATLKEWSMERIMKEVLERLRVHPNHIPSICAIYSLEDHDYWPKQGTAEALPRLADANDLHIVSNTPHASLIHELRSHGMLDYFKTITMSWEVGFRKPHPAIYQEALKRANATAKESIFVSHDEVEVEGARAIGMKGLLAQTLEEVRRSLK